MTHLVLLAIALLLSSCATVQPGTVRCTVDSDGKLHCEGSF